MKRFLGLILVALGATALACSSNNNDDDESSGNACDQACAKLESCGNTTCSVNGDNCTGKAKDIADCINESPCDQTNQCLFGGSGGSGGGGGSGGSGGSTSGDCADIAGTWQVSGSCGVDDCVITQNGCSVNFSCNDGAASYTGTATQSSVNFTGVTGSCQGVISGNVISGTCSSAIGICDYVATR